MFLKTEITASISTGFCFVLLRTYKGQGWKKYKIFGTLPLKSTKINGVVKKILNFTESQCTDQNTGGKKLKLEFSVNSYSIKQRFLSTNPQGQLLTTKIFL